MVTGAAGAVIAAILLVACLALAVVRPRGLSEAVPSVAAAAVLIGLGTVPWSAARHTLAQLGPTVAFLALILLFGQLCAQAGVFDYLGAAAGRVSHGSRPRLLAVVVGVAALVTVTLTLDATVVLLTPVVIRTAQRLRVVGRPHLYACQQLANSGSLLLPISNLTNLLAFPLAGLSFGRFAALMALPWVAVVVATGVALRLFFAADLRDDGPPAAEDGPPAANGPDADRPSAPRYALVVLGLTVAAAVLASSLHVAPAWAAAGGCLLLAGPRLARRQTTPLWLVREASPGFCVFVLALAVVVDGVTRNGLADALRHLVPDGQSLPTLLAIAALAAVLANLINNLPATLVLVPLVAGSPVAVLAVLLGVNIGPNLTYVGSLATLLWRRLLPDADRPRGRQFHRFGALSVPPILALATVLLWLSSLVVS